MSNPKKQNRLSFTLNSVVNEDVKLIENYYDEPASKILLDEIIMVVKKKRAALPESFVQAQKSPQLKRA